MSLRLRPWTTSFLASSTNKLQYSRSSGFCRATLEWKVSPNRLSVDSEAMGSADSVWVQCPSTRSKFDAVTLFRVCPKTRTARSALDSSSGGTTTAGGR